MLKKELVEMIVANGWATETELKGLKKTELEGIKAMMERKEKEETTMTAKERFEAMNPSFVKEEKEEEVELICSDGPSIVALPEKQEKLEQMNDICKEMIKGKNPLKHDKMLRKENMVIDFNLKKEVVVTSSKEDNGALLCQLLIQEWFLQTVSEEHMYKDDKGRKWKLFYDSKKYPGNKMSKMATKVTANVIEELFGRSYGKLAIYKAWEKLAGYGFCHVIEGDEFASEKTANGGLKPVRDKEGNPVKARFVLISEEEWKKIGYQYAKLFKNANALGFKTVKEYVLSKRS